MITPQSLLSDFVLPNNRGHNWTSDKDAKEGSRPAAPVDEMVARVRFLGLDGWQCRCCLSLDHDLVLHLLDQVDRF